jgi:enediyne biosynthesis protein E4
MGPCSFSSCRRSRTRVPPLFLVLAAALLSIPAATARAPLFADVTAPAGIRFVHTSGAFGKKYLPETIGSGVVFFDADGDARQDLLFVNSSRWPGRTGPKTTPSLYRNNGNGTFSDVTAGSGLDVVIYGIGAAAADFDNDGHEDVYITALGGNRLFRGRGAARFAEVTSTAGVGDGGFSTSALWFDYDRDGRLDLFVVHYVDWSIETDLFCTLDGKAKSYCTPESYKGRGPTLYRNRGNGTFEDVTRHAALFDTTSKGLGVAMLDYDGDGWMDLFVANDTQPNRLYRNKGDGSFADVGTIAGVAFSEAGVARAGMGVDAADYDGSGRPGIIVGNFSSEMMALYHNEGRGLFIDEAPTTAIGRATLLTLTFACFFFDYDLDGRPDIFAANGHVADDIERVQGRVHYAQRPHLFRNAGGRKFDEVAGETSGLAQALVARGAAYADYDEDGDLDLAVTVNNGPARLYRNDTDRSSHLLRVQTIGSRANRDGVGARVDVSLEDGGRLWQIVKTGSSYASQSELPLTFGLGGRARATGIRVTWPGGRVDEVGPIAADHLVVVKEGAGLVTATPLKRGS